MMVEALDSRMAPRISQHILRGIAVDEFYFC